MALAVHYGAVLASCDSSPWQLKVLGAELTAAQLKHGLFSMMLWAVCYPSKHPLAACFDLLSRMTS